MVERANKTTLTTATVADGCGAGGTSTPPSARTAGATQSATASADASKTRLSMILTPSFKDSQSVTIVRHNDDEDSRNFNRLFAANHADALRFCEDRLRLLAEDDFASHLRWASGAAMCLRAMRDLRGAMRTHLVANGLTTLVRDPQILGTHLHGLAFTRMESGELPEALVGFKRSKELFTLAGRDAHAAAADNNAGLVLVRLGRAREALPLVKAALEVAEDLRDFSLAAEFADTLRLAYDARCE